MQRRSFLTGLLSTASALVLDPERALWVPGAKTIFIPPAPEITAPQVGLSTRLFIDGHDCSPYLKSLELKAARTPLIDMTDLTGWSKGEYSFVQGVREPGHITAELLTGAGLAPLLSRLRENFHSFDKRSVVEVITSGQAQGHVFTGNIRTYERYFVTENHPEFVRLSFESEDI